MYGVREQCWTHHKQFWGKLHNPHFWGHLITFSENVLKWPQKGRFRKLFRRLWNLSSTVPEVWEHYPDAQSHVSKKLGNRPFWCHLDTFLEIGEQKKFFSKNQILFQLPPPFLILFHLLLSLFLDSGFFEKPKCAFPTQKRRSTKVLQWWRNLVYNM